MKTIDITTSQNVTIEYQLASVLDRFFAMLLDWIILAVWLLLCSIMSSSYGEPLYSSGASFILLVFFFPVFAFYNLFMELFNGGRSVGKLALGIKVVSLNGQNPNISECFLRWALRILEIFGTLGSVAAIFASSSEKNQRMGDLIAGTVVIKLNKTNKYTLKDVLSIKSSENYVPRFHQVLRYNDDDMLLIKNCIDRARRFPNTASRKLIKDLAARVKDDINISEMPKDNKGRQVDDLTFLRGLIQDYVVLTRS